LFPRPFPFRNGRFFVDKAAVGVYVIRNEGNRRIMTTPTILIDAYSQIFRAYYAIRQLNNSRGEPTNAVFVFARMLLKLENTTVPILQFVLMRNGTHEYYLCSDRFQLASYGAAPVTIRGRSFRVPSWRVPVLYIESVTPVKAGK